VRAVSVLATLVGMFPMLAACGRVANLGINEQDCTVSSTKLELFFIAGADVSEMTR
jgi:hypothetical protein